MLAVADVLLPLSNVLESRFERGKCVRSKRFNQFNLNKFILTRGSLLTAGQRHYAQNRKRGRKHVRDVKKGEGAFDKHMSSISVKVYQSNISSSNSNVSSSSMFDHHVCKSSLLILTKAYVCV